MAINNIIVSDSHIFRDEMKRNFESDQVCVVRAECKNVQEALLLVDTYKPDVVIIDLDRNPITGLEETRQLIELNPKIKTIMLSNETNEDVVLEALDIGVNGYLLKEMNKDLLVHAVKLVVNGGCFLDPKITRSFVNGYRRLVAASIETDDTRQNQSSSRDIRRPLHLLTRRECEVLQLLADGKSNRGISESIFISEKTVKNHVSSILQKMNAKDRTHAVVVAIKNGWVEVR